MSLPLKIVRTGPAFARGVGKTRNVCSRGVFFASDVKIDIGESVEYIITFPGDTEHPEQVDLRCLGKVLRLEEHAGECPSLPFSVAATIERYEFVRNET